MLPQKTKGAHSSRRGLRAPPPQITGQPAASSGARAQLSQKLVKINPSNKCVDAEEKWTLQCRPFLTRIHLRIYGGNAHEVHYFPKVEVSNGCTKCCFSIAGELFTKSFTTNSRKHADSECPFRVVNFSTRSQLTPLCSAEETTNLVNTQSTVNSFHCSIRLCRFRFRPSGFKTLPKLLRCFRERMRGMV